MAQVNLRIEFLVTSTQMWTWLFRTLVQGLYQVVFVALEADFFDSVSRVHKDNIWLVIVRFFKSAFCIRNNNHNITFLHQAGRGAIEANFIRPSFNNIG